MSSASPRPGSQVGWGELSTSGGRMRERLLALASGLLALALALAASLETPSPSIGSVAAVVAIALVAVALLTLVISTRYEITLTVLAIYLGLLDGPLKLESASRLASAGRDIVIAAIALGMLMRLFLRHERVKLPAMSGWVLAFGALVIVETLNPYTANILKVLGGYRQELEFLPCFFFGYLIIRSKRRFRQLFLLLGVIALADGLVGGYQSRLTPAQLASWGPGYRMQVEGNGEGLTGRTYTVEGVGHPRPMGLGSDAGSGGVAGIIAIPGLLALLLAGKLRRRWPVVLCGLGALAAIATSASRTITVVAVVELVVFALVLLIAGLNVRRTLIGLAIGLALAGSVGVALIALDGTEVLHRQEGLVNTRVKEGTGLEVEQEAGEDDKTRNLGEIPRDLVDAPFGLGLGVTAAASGFGGHTKPLLEEEKVAGGSAYNLLAVETGAIGLFLWLGLSGSLLVLAARRLKRVTDTELRLYLVAMVTTFIALSVQGLSGPTLAVSPSGAYLWFAPGVLAFWLAGPGRTAIGASSPEPLASASAGPTAGTAGA
jgi:hypothetical protein